MDYKSWNYGNEYVSVTIYDNTTYTIWTNTHEEMSKLLAEIKLKHSIPLDTEAKLYTKDEMITHKASRGQYRRKEERIMLKDVSFEELPEDIQARVNSVKDMSTRMGDPEPEILRCEKEEHNGQNFYSRCTVKIYNGCIGIFDKYHDNPAHSIYLYLAPE